MVVEAAKAIAARLRPGQLVVLGEHDLSRDHRGAGPARCSEERGLKVGRDFFLAFSPERVDPGNARFNTRNTPKIIGGVTPRLHAGRAGALRPGRRHGDPGLVAARRARW